MFFGKVELEDKFILLQQNMTMHSFLTIYIFMKFLKYPHTLSYIFI